MSATAAECCTLPEFFKKYKWYCISLLGIMLLAMFHAMTENYLIEVAGRLGGNSSSVGVALFIATVVEMPVFLCFDFFDTVLLLCSNLILMLSQSCAFGNTPAFTFG